MPHSPISTFATSAVHAWRVNGKACVNAAGETLNLRGVTYGPFSPRDGREDNWPHRSEIELHLQMLAQNQVKLLRIYELPSTDLLELCEAQGFDLIVGIPWTQHVAYLQEPELWSSIQQWVTYSVSQLAQHACVKAILVGNEIEKTLVRWGGPDAVRDSLEHLIELAKRQAPHLLISYANYPSTEYLQPRNADFVAFNVFLEDPQVFENYLYHLHRVAGQRPLVITEFGLDALQYGEAKQAEVRQWFERICQCLGVSAYCWFAFSDDWYRGGELVNQWQFGWLSTEGRLKAAAQLKVEDSVKPPDPKCSVVVCTHNGEATLHACLMAISRLQYTNYEVLIIDDGSVDGTARIAAEFPEFRYHYTSPIGLSAARNLGWKMADGELIAYTDDDCLVDPFWLTYVVQAFEDQRCVAAGGPNISPPARNLVEASVAVAPGAPMEVLLNAREAEHLPGCNLVVRRSALEEVAGFNPLFRSAGDDVDLGWRLRARGGVLRFVPAAFVWHHRRFTLSAYFKQQRGYGRAEALLMSIYPERFAWFGGAKWSGMIYGDAGSDSVCLSEQSIHFGQLGLAPFQCIYAEWRSGVLWMAQGLLWNLLAVLIGVLGWGWLSLGMLVLQGYAAWRQTRLKTAGRAPLTGWQRLLVTFLTFAQPLVRDFARFKGMWELDARPQAKSPPISWPQWRKRRDGPRVETDQHWSFWSDTAVDRQEFLQQLCELASRQGWNIVNCGEHSHWDLHVYGDNSVGLLTSTVEYHERKRCRLRLAYRSLSGSSQAVGCLAKQAAHAMYLNEMKPG